MLNDVLFLKKRRIREAAAAPRNFFYTCTCKRGENGRRSRRVADAHFADTKDRYAVMLCLRGKLDAGENAPDSLFARHGGLTVQILRALAEAAVDDLGAMIRELDAHVDDDELVPEVLGKARRAGEASCEVDGLRERDRLRRGAYALFDNAVVRRQHIDARFGKFVFDLSGDTGQLNGKVLQKPEASGGLCKLRLPRAGLFHCACVKARDPGKVCL